MKIRRYGESGPLVIVLHGGPGAAGYMAPVARGLAKQFTVLEPFQRRAGQKPVTVARHVQDLHDLIHAEAGEPPALVGSSWGAMLALAYAAEHPKDAGPLVLIGCGTFDLAARGRMNEIRTERMTDELQEGLARLAEEISNPDERLARMGEQILPMYSHDPIDHDLEIAECDAQGNLETWEDMVRLQTDRVYPAQFACIESPVLMLHGALDPHPGPMIRDSLLPVLPQLEYHEWRDCGHYPWIERSVRDDFFARLTTWLQARCGGTDA